LQTNLGNSECITWIPIMYFVISFFVYYLTKVTALSSFKELHIYFW
jgi:hypothetical protein